MNSKPPKPIFELLGFVAFLVIAGGLALFAANLTNSIGNKVAPIKPSPSPTSTKLF